MQLSKPPTSRSKGIHCCMLILVLATVVAFFGFADIIHRNENSSLLFSTYLGLLFLILVIDRALDKPLV